MELFEGAWAALSLLVGLLALFLAWNLLITFAKDSTPTKAALEQGCIRHGGITSVSNVSEGNGAVVVCRDGKLWFASPN